MPKAERSITVVIPSRGLTARAGHLWRAVESVTSQEGVRATALLVINGSERDPALAASLGATAGVRVLERDEADLPAAHRAGRDAVDTPWFCTLDDDDELLPGALDKRLQLLEDFPETDVVVTNGFRQQLGTNVLHVPDDVMVADDPLRALVGRNWLLPGSWLARSTRVGVSLYDGMPRYRECTFLALRFANEYRMRWLQEPTVIYHIGSPSAETRTRGYLMGQTEAVQRMLALPLPAWFRRHLRREVSGALHEAADQLWQSGDLADAWRLHLRSLRHAGGLRFIPFTGHLLGASLRRAISGRASCLG